ncbi:MAG: STAS/SEC14 domain-containing protein [Acidimicrobiia bacterium]
MIQVDTGTPENVIVATASGRVTAEDYEHTLMPAVDRATSGGEKARFLYILGSDFEGYESAAAGDDAKLGMHHWADFQRIAVVTDHETYRVFTRVFGFVMPGKVKTFTVAETDKAREWIVADD